MADVQTVGWSAVVVGVLQLLSIYTGIGANFYAGYILAVVVVALGLWAVYG